MPAPEIIHYEAYAMFSKEDPLNPGERWRSFYGPLVRTSNWFHSAWPHHSVDIEYLGEDFGVLLLQMDPMLFKSDAYAVDWLEAWVKNIGKVPIHYYIEMLTEITAP